MEARRWGFTLRHRTGPTCNAECLKCGYRDCPDREPLHYHHDGCPACDATAEAVIAAFAEVADATASIGLSATTWWDAIRDD